MSVTGVWEALCWKTERRHFSGGPVVRILHFRGRAAGPIIIQGTKIPYAMHLGGKIEKKKDRKEKVRGKKEEGI